MSFRSNDRYIPSSSDSDSDDIEGEVARFKEPDPTSVDFYFMKTGKSKGEGVLVTHNSTFKFTKNNMNRNGTIIYSTCGQKLLHRCAARAIVSRDEIRDESDQAVVQYILVEVATFFLGIVLFSSDVKFLMRICFHVPSSYLFITLCTVSYCMVLCKTMIVKELQKTHMRVVRLKLLLEREDYTVLLHILQYCTRMAKELRVDNTELHTSQYRTSCCI